MKPKSIINLNNKLTDDKTGPVTNNENINIDGSK